jgi:hypothetical protein
MRFLKLTTAYPAFLNGFYAQHPELDGVSYAQHRDALNKDLFYLCDLWTPVLTPLGYDVFEVTINAEGLQRAWAREHGMASDTSLAAIAIQQAREYQPDVLLYEDNDADLLARVREVAPSMKLVFTTVGSALFPAPVWRDIRLFVSCAPESVTWLRDQGFVAEHMDHSFDARINAQLIARPKSIDATFIGSIVRGSQFHLERERILEALLDLNIDLSIFSPSADLTWRDDAKWLLRNASYDALATLQKAGVRRELIERAPVLKQMNAIARKSLRPVNPKLKGAIKPPVFGLAMFQTLRDSKVALNIHADSSPTHASNGRLFETSGVGTLLVTDWRDNLPKLFEPGKEMVAYRTPQEAAELIRYYLDHADERERIAQAAQRRTLSQYTYAQRAHELDAIIRRHL